MRRMSKVDLSYNHITTIDAGFLVPIGILEVLPGDVVKTSADMFLRAQPLVRPMLHETIVEVSCFYVPNRLLWTDWDKFRNNVPAESPPATTPQIVLPTVGPNTQVADYMGVECIAGQSISALPIRAYNFIVNRSYYNRWTDYVADRTQDDMTLARALWNRDYFTSARTAPQLGAGASVPLFFGGQAPIRGMGVIGAGGAALGSTAVRETGGAAATYPAAYNLGGANYVSRVTGTGATLTPDVYADLSAVAASSGILISDLRKSIQAQDWAELRKKIGDDYVDWFIAIGASRIDQRVREPIRLGTVRRRMAYSEVMSTAEVGTQKVGEMAGHGASMTRARGMRFGVPEDGFIVYLASVVPVPAYAGGVPRMFSRDTIDKFWSPQYEGIGDQPILNKELRAGHATPNGTFGWQDRFYDYKRSFDRVTGEMRSGLEGRSWHWARIFASDPALNPSFVLADPRVDVFADTNTDHFVCSAQIQANALRLIQFNREVL